MTVSTVAPYGGDVQRYLKALEALRNRCVSIVRNDFKDDGELRNEISERFRKAKDIILHIDKRLRGISYHGVEGYRFVYSSTEYLEHGPEKIVVVKTLDGLQTVVKSGTPMERAIHIVEVSRWRFKCSCPDAVFTSSIADRKLMKLVRSITQPVLYKYNLCKHVIASLSILFSRKQISLEEIEMPLWLSILSLFLRIKDENELRKHVDILDKAVVLLKPDRA